VEHSYLRFDRPLPTEYSPGRCLPFDRIGARQPGIVASAGPSSEFQRTGNLACPSTLWPVAPYQPRLMPGVHPLYS